MAKIGEIIYNIKSLRDGGEFSKDHKLGNRQLEYIIDIIRAKIATYTEMGKLSLEGYLQELKNVPLTKSADFSSLDENVIVFETTTLPDLITADGFGKLFDFVGTRNAYLGFQKTTPQYFNLDLSRTLTHTVYFTQGEKLYIATTKYHNLRSAFIRGVFASPRKVLEFNNDTNATNMEWQYPTPQNFVQQLNSELVQSELQWLNMLPPDDKNDGRDKKGSEV